MGKTVKKKYGNNHHTHPSKRVHVHTAPPTVLPVVPRTALFAPVFTRTDFSHANFLFHHHVVFRGSFVNERPIEKIPVKRDPNVGSKFLAMVKKSTQSENSTTNKENKEQPLILFAPPKQPNQRQPTTNQTNHQPTYKLASSASLKTTKGPGY